MAAWLLEWKMETLDSRYYTGFVQKPKPEDFGQEWKLQVIAATSQKGFEWKQAALKVVVAVNNKECTLCVTNTVAFKIIDRVVHVKHLWTLFVYIFVLAHCLRKITLKEQFCHECKKAGDFY